MGLNTLRHQQFFITFYDPSSLFVTDNVLLSTNSRKNPGMIHKIFFFLGQSSQMYVNVTRSQTEEPKLEYSYATPQQQASGSQHLTQQTTYLSESDFGSHATPTKEEPALFTISSQQPTQQQSQQQTQQQSQQSTLPGTQGLLIYKVLFYPVCMHIFYYHPWRSD